MGVNDRRGAHRSQEPPQLLAGRHGKLEAMTDGDVSYTKAFAETESVTILDTGDSLIMLPQAVLEDLFPTSKGFLLLAFGPAIKGRSPWVQTPSATARTCASLWRMALRERSRLPSTSTRSIRV